MARYVMNLSDEDRERYAAEFFNTARGLVLLATTLRSGCDSYALVIIELLGESLSDLDVLHQAVQNAVLIEIPDTVPEER